jgi:uncharacterized protein (UPF0332 family)
MTRGIHEKKSLSETRMEKAREFLDDAVESFSRGRYRTAVNRAYYAVHSAARSLLILEGLDPESHDETITLLDLNYAGNGRLPGALIAAFRSLLTRRIEADYGDFDETGREIAEDSVSAAGEAVARIDALRRKLRSVILE